MQGRTHPILVPSKPQDPHGQDDQLGGTPSESLDVLENADCKVLFRTRNANLELLSTAKPYEVLGPINTVNELLEEMKIDSLTRTDGAAMQADLAKTGEDKLAMGLSKGGNEQCLTEILRESQPNNFQPVSQCKDFPPFQRYQED